MKTRLLVLIAVCLLGVNFKSKAQSINLNAPIVNSQVIFEETKGIVAVEAEYFYKQTKDEVRKWYRTSKNELPVVGRDDDGQHCVGASNNAYLEILPDERVVHADKLVKGTNFTDEPGLIAVLHYKISFKTPGRYYVWARAFSTGSEDNGVHIGLDGEWPEHGQRIQWCDGKNQWTWSNKQRTKEVHCGVPNEIYIDIEKAGIHEIQFSMREDGFEFDKFILTNDVNYIPNEKGPEVVLEQGKLPAAYPIVEASESTESYFTNISKSLTANKVITAQEFPTETTNFYKNGKNWLAIDPKLYEEAQTSTTFDFETGKYDVLFVGVGENDGSSTFTVLINGQELGIYSPPLSDKIWEEGKMNNALWENISLKKGDKLTVIGKIGSADGKEHTRARWAGIIFAPVGKGKQIQEAPSTDTFIK